MSHPVRLPSRMQIEPNNIEAITKNLAKDPFNPQLIQSARKLAERNGVTSEPGRSVTVARKPTKIDAQEPSLGYPVGLTQGTFNQNEMRVNKSAVPLLTICTSYYAFAYTYIKPPVRWCPKTMNDIVIAGAGLLKATEQRCQRLQVPLSEKEILRKFQIQNYCFEVTATSEPEIIGNLVSSTQQKVINIYRGLKQFFSRGVRRGCLFRCENVQLLIWRSDRIFFVYDPRGRTETCAVDLKRGFASLICLETLHNVTFLIVNMSELGPHDFFALSQVRVIKLLQVAETPSAAVTCNSDVTVVVQDTDPERRFVVLDEHSAILHGCLTVCNPCFSRTRNYQALTSCCIAYVYSLIRPPNSWTSRTVDKVLLFGNQMYEECVRQDFPEEFTIQNIPPMITVGIFKAALRIMPFQHGGRLNHTLDHRTSELLLALRQFFDEHRCALLQIDQLSLASWKRGNVYYLFDPYIRDANGKVMHHTQGAACIHMHSTLESLCAVLYMNLMRLAEKEVFYVHGLWARVMDSRASGDDVAFSEQHQTDELQRTEAEKEESVSLNESIDSVYVPRLHCRGRNIDTNNNIQKSECNLDSPSVSATQFIRPWHMIKDEVMTRCQEVQSESDASGLSDFDGDEDDEEENDDEEEPNNNFGLSNTDYEKLLEAGLTDDEIRAYMKSGASPEDMLIWKKEGVSPREMERLRAAGVTDPKDFRNYRKWGMTVADCERQASLGITPKQYAKMKKMGVEPDQMFEFLSAKENADKFRDSNLNHCQITRLSQAGVTADEFEKATNEGLTYEEVLHATKNKIPSEDFARMKDMGMSSVDIVKSKQMALTPEEYMEMKELCLNSQEMEGLKKINISAEEYSALRKLGYSTDEHLSEYAKMKCEDDSMTPAKYHAYKTDNANNDALGNDNTEMEGKERTTTEEKEKDTVEITTMDNKELDTNQDTTKTESDKDAKRTDTEDIDAVNQNIEPDNPPSCEPEIGSIFKQTSDALVTSSLNVIAPPEVVSGTVQRTAKATTLDKVTSLISGSPNKTSNASKIGVTELPTAFKPGSPYSDVESKPDSSQSPAAITSTVSPQQSPKSSYYNRTTNETIAGTSPTGVQQKISDPKHNLAVVKSAACTPISFLKLLTTSFKMVDRVLILNNKDEPTCVAFKNTRGPPPADQQYFLYEGCPCNLDQIRRLVIGKSKNLLTPCRNMDDMIERIIKRLSPVRTRCSSAPAEEHCGLLMPDQQQAVRFARELLDDKLELINTRLNELMKDFEMLKSEEK